MIELSNGENWSSKAEFRLQNSHWLKYSSKIARRILAVIKERKDLNQSRLALELGISPQQVSKIVKGHENLTLESIANISAALGVDLINFPDYKYGIEKHLTNTDRPIEYHLHLNTLKPVKVDKETYSKLATVSEHTIAMTPQTTNN